MDTRYYKHTDTRASIYYSEHKDMFRQLELNILGLYKNYINDYAVQRLKSIKHIEENGYKFRGVTDDWIDDFSKIRFKVNASKLSGDELKRYMPLQTIFIKNVVYSIYTDLQYLTYLYLEGYTESYLNDYAKDIDKVLSSDFSNIEIDYCRKFHALGLGIPSLLLTEYNKLYSQVILSSHCKDFYSSIGEDYEDYKDTNIKLIDIINIQLLDGKLDSSNIELASLAKSFKLAYSKCVTQGIESVESLVGMTKRQVYRTQAAKGIRLATSGEIESRIPQLIVEEEYLIAKTNYVYLVTFAYLCTGNQALLDTVDVTCNLEDIISGDTLKLLNSVAKYMTSAKFDKDLVKLQKAKSIRYPKTAVDEIKDKSLDDKLKQVYDSLVKRKEVLSNFEKVTFDIAVQGIRGKKLSDKQVNIINKTYNELNSGTQKANFYTKEVENKILACQSYFSYKGNAFFTGLFEAVLKYKRCSEKQLNCINEEYNKMLEHQKLVLERESQYVVRNTKQRSDEENQAIQDLKIQQSVNSAKNIEAHTNEEDSGIKTLIFGDYVFEDVDS